MYLIAKVYSICNCCDQDMHTMVGFIFMKNTSNLFLGLNTWWLSGAIKIQKPMGSEIFKGSGA